LAARRLLAAAAATSAVRLHMSRAQEYNWSQAEKPPLLDGFFVASVFVEPVCVGDVCRVVKRAIVRKTAATTSERLGQLESGDVITILQKQAGKGLSQRVRFESGWVSLRSKKGDWLMVKDTPAGVRSVDHYVSYPRRVSSGGAAAAAEGSGGAAAGEGGEGSDPAPPKLEHFCLPTLAEAWEGAYTAHYTFVRTLDDQTRQYGFCARVRRETPGSTDVLPGGEGAQAAETADRVEVICILTRYLWFSIFNRLLATLTKQRSASLGEVDSLARLTAVMDAVSAAALRRFPPPGAELSVLIPPKVALGTGGEGASVATGGGPALCLTRPDDELDDIDHRELFRALGVPGVLAIFRALLSEQRVIMVSGEISRLSACMHSATALLDPFRWQQIFVPMLPQELLDYVTAPMPFVCGIHTSQLPMVLRLPTEEELVFAKLDTVREISCTGGSGRVLQALLYLFTQEVSLCGCCIMRPV
jgi:hypothetical protein